MKRPNILFIMADQMAAPLLPIYADSPLQMPHLTRLAAQAVVFDSAYCNSPLCAPSRFTLVSGQLPSRIGPMTMQQISPPISPPTPIICAAWVTERHCQARCTSVGLINCTATRNA